MTAELVCIVQTMTLLAGTSHRSNRAALHPPATGITGTKTITSGCRRHATWMIERPSATAPTTSPASSAGRQHARPSPESPLFHEIPSLHILSHSGVIAR